METNRQTMRYFDEQGKNADALLLQTIFRYLLHNRKLLNLFHRYRTPGSSGFCNLQS